MWQGQQPPWSRWTGRRGRKIFLAPVGLDQGLLEGGPLGGEALAAGLGQDVLDQLDKAAAQASGEVVNWPSSSSTLAALARRRGRFWRAALGCRLAVAASRVGTWPSSTPSTKMRSLPTIGQK